MVTIENYEEYLMLAADGELDAAGQAALQDFMAAHPALQGELAVWQSLKLQPDLSHTYSGKDALIRQEGKGRTIGFRPFALAAAAAVLLALVLIPALMKKDAGVPAIVHAFADPEPAVPVRDHYSDSLSQIGVTPERGKPRPPSKPGAPVERNRIAKQVSVPTPVAVPVRQDSVIALNSVRPAALSEKGVQAPAPMVGEVASVTVQPQVMPSSVEPRQPLITWAPENRQALQLLKQAFEQRVAQATSAAKTIKETALVIRLGNGSVNINL